MGASMFLPGRLPRWLKREGCLYDVGTRPKVWPLVITSHPYRNHLWARLQSGLRGLTLCVDDSEIPGRDSLRKNFVAAIRKSAQLAERLCWNWALIGDDDILPVADLPEAMHQILRTAPKDAAAVSFYSNRKWDTETKSRWRKKRKRELFLKLLAAIRLEHVDEIINRMDAAASGRSTDGILTDFVDEKGLTVYVHIPSLVQHDNNEVSLLGHPPRPGGRERCSRTFPGQQTSAWSFLERDLA